jgi:hypothetical protein
MAAFMAAIHAMRKQDGQPVCDDIPVYASGDCFADQHVLLVVVLTVLPAGLVYRHFGREVLASILGIPVSHPDMDAIYLQVYKVGPGSLYGDAGTCFIQWQWLGCCIVMLGNDLNQWQTWRAGYGTVYAH